MSEEILISEVEQPKEKRLTFEELTLWQVFWLFLYHPLPTMRRFFDEIALPLDAPPVRDFDYPVSPPSEDSLISPIEETEDDDFLDEYALPDVDFGKTINVFYTGILFGLVISVLLAIIGASRLWKATNDPVAHVEGDLKGAPVWFFLAILVYLITSLAASYPWWMNRIRQMGGGNAPPQDDEPTPPPEASLEEMLPLELLPDSEQLPVDQQNVPPAVQTIFNFIERHAIRLALIPPALFMSYLSYTENVIYDQGKISQIAFTTPGFIAWVLAILFWFCVLAVDLNGIVTRLYAAIRGRTRLFPRQRLRFKLRWQHIVLLLIFLLAAYFRLHDLEKIPPDMTSDHIEKLKDAVRVSEGFHAIFFENNGGREAFQMYFIALLEKLPGVEFNFTAIKLASVIEGLLTIPVGYWLGKTIAGNETPEDREMGIWLGLAFAALLAISSWHIMLSRLGLRIVLTPLTTALLLIFLIRAMHHNRRLDFVIVGLILGAGIYFYQANRMLPIVVVIGILLAIAINARNRLSLWHYGLNLFCTVIMALVIFLPMYRYEREYPEFFWSRTRGRMFGDNAFERINPQTGQKERYEPGIGEQIDRFLDNFDNFEENYLNALKMWSWKGDGAWINNPDGRPAFDPYTDGLFLLGVAAWLVLIVKKWDAVYILMPIGILIMILPSALAIHEAIQSENPSFTRSSGTIPFVFLIAAYPLAQIGFYARRVTRYSTLNLAVALLLIFPIITLAAPINYDTYFEKYPAAYNRSWKPYTFFAEPLREYLDNGGTMGNAFYIHREHWLDHRILGATAGDFNWPNGLVTRDQVFSRIEMNQNTPYQYDPSKPIFFMYHQKDEESKTWLSNNFPGGQHYVHENIERPDLSFGYYIVPAGAQFVGG